MNNIPNLKKLLEARIFELNNIVIDLENGSIPKTSAKYQNSRAITNLLNFNIYLYRFLYKGMKKC